MSRKYIYVFLFSCFFRPSQGDAQAVIFSALPIFRCMTSFTGESSCDTLTALEAAKRGSKILRTQEGSYIWGEDGRPLTTPSSAGMYDLWQGLGMYIKVWKHQKQIKIIGEELTAKLPDAFKAHQTPWFYMEHTQMGLGTITYYGYVSTYFPPYEDPLKRKTH